MPESGYNTHGRDCISRMTLWHSVKHLGCALLFQVSFELFHSQNLDSNIFTDVRATHLGCYTESDTPVMSVNVGQNFNTVEKCVPRCYLLRYRYAALRVKSYSPLSVNLSGS